MANKFKKSLLAGLQGFDEEGNPLPEEGTENPEGTEDGTNPEAGAGEQPEATPEDGAENPEGTEPEVPAEPVEPEIVVEPRVVEDVAVVDTDASAPGEEEETVTSEILQQTVALEAFEDEAGELDGQIDVANRIQGELDDAIVDNAPAIEEGGIATESHKMILSMLKRLKKDVGAPLGNEVFSTKFGLEGFGESKSIRKTNSKALLNALGNEADSNLGRGKAIAAALMKTIVDILNTVANIFDGTAKNAESLSKKVAEYKGTYNGGTFKSSKIANCLVKDDSGATYQLSEFADKLAKNAVQSEKISDNITKVINELKTVAQRAVAETKKGDAAAVADHDEQVNEFIRTRSTKIGLPAIRQKEVFAGVTIEGDDLASVTKVNVTASNDELPVASKDEVTKALALVVTAGNAIKAARKQYGNLYKAKMEVGAISDKLTTELPKDASAELKASARKQAKEIANAARDELNALKTLNSALGRGAKAVYNYCDVSFAKATGKEKKAEEPEASAASA